MKKTLLIALCLISTQAFAGTFQDKVSCALGAKVATKESGIKKLKRVLAIGADVLVEGLKTEYFGVKKKLYQKEWNGYSHSMVGYELDSELNEIIQIDSIRKYTTNDIYVNRSGIHNNRVKEFKVKLKKIKKDKIATLLEAMGFEGTLNSKANKNLRPSMNTEFDKKSQEVTVEFKEEGVKAIFTFSCSNSVQLNGRQFF